MLTNQYFFPRLHRIALQAAKSRWVKCRKCDHAYLPNETEALEHQSTPFCTTASNSTMVYTKPPRRTRKDKKLKKKPSLTAKLSQGALDHDFEPYSRISVTRFLVCNICNVYLPTRQLLRQHMDEHQNADRETDEEEDYFSESPRKKRAKTEEFDNENEPSAKKQRRSITSKSYAEFDVDIDDADNAELIETSLDLKYFEFLVKDCSVRISDRYLQLWKQCPDCLSFVRTSKVRNTVIIWKLDTQNPNSYLCQICIVCFSDVFLTFL